MAETALRRIGSTTYDETPQITGEDYGNVVAHDYTLDSDGWITDIRVLAGGEGEAIAAKPSLWDGDTGEVIHASPEQTWTNTLTWRKATPNKAIRAGRGQKIRVGFWRDRKKKCKFGHYKPGARSQVATYTTTRDVPSVYPNPDPADGQLAADFGFVANAEPTAPSYLPEMPDNEADITTTTPTIAFDLPHKNGDGDYDFTDSVQIEVYDETAQANIFNAELEVTPTEIETGTLIRNDVVVTIHGRYYRVRVRHRDSWGRWSEWSRVRRFRCVAGPRRTLVTYPRSQRITASKPEQFAGTYTSTQNKAFNGVQIELYNERGNRRLLASGVLASTPAVQGTFESPWSVGNTWMGTYTLKWGTKYRWRARVRDATGDWSEWSPKVLFWTNEAPNIPKNLTPAEGVVSPNPRLSMALSDANNDPITRVDVRLFNVTDNVNVLAGSPWSSNKAYAVGNRVRPTTPNGRVYVVTVAGTSGTVQPAWPLTVGSSVTLNGVTYKEDGSDLDHLATIHDNYKKAYFDIGDVGVLGKSYKWQARAYDDGPPSPSGFSGWQDFVFNQAPELTLLGPTEAIDRNLIAQTPNYDPLVVGSWWEDTGTAVGTNAFDRINDDDVAFGPYCFRGVVTNTTEVLRRRSPLLSVTASKPYLCSAWVKREQLAGVATSTLGVECYNSSGTLITTLYPSSFAALNNADPAQVWTRYGGTIKPVGGTGVAFPTGTTHIKVLMVPSATTASRVRFDGVYFREVASTLEPKWFGYFDGDYTGFGAIDDYLWDGTPGFSSSTGESVLDEPQPNVIFSYYSQGSLAKASDRLRIQKWDKSAWVTVYDSGYIASTRTSIPLPPGVLTNNDRFRLRVDVKDTTGLVGSTNYIQFDVMYTGPPELLINQATGYPDKGIITIGFAPSDLPALQFDRIEVVREPGGGGQQTVIAVLRDVGATEVTDHFPVSGAPYTYRIRQVEAITGELVTSRWTSANVTVDYMPTWFLKDVEDPARTTAGFYLLAEDVPTFDYLTEITSLRAWGERLSVDYPSTERRRTGNLTIRLKDEQVTPGSTLDKLLELVELRRTVCLLTHQPTRKIFCMLKNVKEVSEDVPWYSTFDVAWQEVKYIESYYEREAM